MCVVCAEKRSKKSGGVRERDGGGVDEERKTENTASDERAKLAFHLLRRKTAELIFYSSYCVDICAAAQAQRGSYVALSHVCVEAVSEENESGSRIFTRTLKLQRTARKIQNTCSTPHIRVGARVRATRH